jgi:hypothetical protein
VPAATKEEGLALIRFLNLATDDDLVLLNACLAVEDQCRREEREALERLLTLCQFSDGDLDERLVALPDRAFACAVFDLYALGWIERPQDSRT